MKVDNVGLALAIKWLCCTFNLDLKLQTNARIASAFTDASVG
jgi:hypothetical protein